MTETDSKTDQLVRLAEEGDDTARQRLFARHRDRLRRMVAARMNDRLASRFDPSDVVQDALTAATRRLPEYLRQQSVPFYPWLRQIAWERLIDLHRRHLLTQARTVSREQRFALSGASVVQLAQCLVAKGSSPSERLIHNELRSRVRSALDQLREDDREILLMRHVEQLRVDEIAAILNITAAATKSRLRRGLLRLQKILGDECSGVRP